MVNNEVQRYRDALKSTDINIRREAAKALAEIGPGAKDAVPDLVEALDDESTDLIAFSALSRIGLPALAAVPAMRRWLAKTKYSERDRELQEQLPYLPEERQELSITNVASKESQVQSSKHT